MNVKETSARVAAALAWIETQLAICNAATPGNWGMSCVERRTFIWTGRDELFTTDAGGNLYKGTPRDARFIANARTLCPELLEGMKMTLEGLQKLSRPAKPYLCREPEYSEGVDMGRATAADNADELLVKLLTKIESLQ